MLEGVLGPDGTAPEATVPGYDIGGKTGTAEKPENGVYSKTRSLPHSSASRPPPTRAARGGDRRRASGRARRRQSSRRPPSRDRLVCAPRLGIAPVRSPAGPWTVRIIAGRLTLRELIRAPASEVAAPAGDPEIAGLAYSTAAVRRWATCSSACQAFAPTATNSRRGRSSRAPSRSSASGRSALASGDGRCRTCARRWGRSRPASTANPTSELRVVGVTGTNGKTTTAFLVRHILESSGIQHRAARHDRVSRRRRGREVERTTPEAMDLQATFRRDARGGRRRLRDGGLLPRALAAPRGRDRVRVRRVHEPHPGPPRLPRHARGVLRRQAPAVHAGRERSGPPRRSTSTTRSGASWPPRSRRPGTPG